MKPLSESNGIRYGVLDASDVEGMSVFLGNTFGAPDRPMPLVLRVKP